MNNSIILHGLRHLIMALIGLAAMTAFAEDLDLKGYVQTFDENFSSLQVSSAGPGTRWIAHTPWNGDFGDARFDDPGPDGPFTVSRKGLRITARKDASGHWHSGLLSSRDARGESPQSFSQLYGYFEIKTKLPDGPGVWPAFWLSGTGSPGGSAEIDVLEYYGAFRTSFHSNEHLWKDGKDVLGLGHVTNVKAGLLTSQFNTYGVLVTPEITNFYLNRSLIWSTPTPPEYKQPLFILVNLALGSGWPINELQSPQFMDVEYIRVFKKS